MCSTKIKITKAPTPTSRSSRSTPRVHSRWRAKVAVVAAVGLWLPSSLIMVGRLAPQFWTTDAYKAEKAMALIAPRSLTTVESNKSPSAMAPHIDGKTRSFLDTKLLFRGKDVVVDRVSRLTSITAVTQMDISPNRLQRLTDLASRWVEGYISVAVYIRGSDKASSVMRAEDLERFLSEKASLLHRSIIHLVTDARTENATHPEIFYPINILRNIAMEHAPTERVLLLDVDFVPSVGAHSQLMAHMSSFAREDELIALILPAFERRLVEGREDPISSAVALDLPSSKDDLLTAMKTHPDEYTTFHPYSKGHNATDYEKWYSATEPYRINYTDTFEPYFVIEKVSAVPPFWEHFSGYGYNKISWVNEIALSGYTFKVAPDSFLVHINHNYHKQKYRWSRPEMKEEYRLNFNAYVRGKYGKSVWLAQEVLWEELPDKARAAASLLGYDKRSWDSKEDAPAKSKAVLSLDETAAIEMLGLQKHFSYYVASDSGGHGVGKSDGAQSQHQQKQKQYQPGIAAQKRSQPQLNITFGLGDDSTHSILDACPIDSFRHSALHVASMLPGSLQNLGGIEEVVNAYEKQWRHYAEDTTGMNKCLPTWPLSTRDASPGRPGLIINLGAGTTGTSYLDCVLSEGSQLKTGHHIENLKECENQDKPKGCTEYSDEYDYVADSPIPYLAVPLLLSHPGSMTSGVLLSLRDPISWVESRLKHHSSDHCCSVPLVPCGKKSEPMVLDSASRKQHYAMHFFMYQAWAACLASSPRLGYNASHLFAFNIFEQMPRNLRDELHGAVLRFAGDAAPSKSRFDDSWEKCNRKGKIKGKKQKKKKRKKLRIRRYRLYQFIFIFLVAAAVIFTYRNS